MKSFACALVLLTALAWAGCDDSTDEKSDVAPADVTDASPSDVEDTSSDLPQDVADEEVLPDFGFEIRAPKQDYNIQCEGQGWDGNPAFFEGGDADWICTFDYEGQTGAVYVQATPASCAVLMSVVPEYQTQAWISFGSTPKALEAVGYDAGGNHQNNYFWFTYEQKKFTYDHSSYGFGFRVCQPIDCVRVADSDGEILEDGCTKERTLPIVCVPVGADGSFGPLEDTFKPCNGDPNYEE